MQDEGVGADVSRYDQPPTIHLLPKSPDVNGQRSQVSTGRDEDVRQEDRAAKVQRDEATSSWRGKGRDASTKLQVEPSNTDMRRSG